MVAARTRIARRRAVVALLSCSSTRHRGPPRREWSRCQVRIVRILFAPCPTAALGHGGWRLYARVVASGLVRGGESDT